MWQREERVHRRATGPFRGAGAGADRAAAAVPGAPYRPGDGRRRARPTRCWSAGAGSTTCRTRRCRGRTAWPATASPTPSAAAAARSAWPRRSPSSTRRREAEPGPGAGRRGARRGAGRAAPRGRRAAPPVGVGAADPGRDRDRPRHHRQRREHPAAPRPRAAPRASCERSRSRPDMRSREKGGTGDAATTTTSCDARLRAADPASSLPPADPAWVARLLEDTMSNDVLTESRETGTHNRSPLTWLVAAAAAVIIAGVGVFAVVNGLADPTTRRPVAGSDRPDTAAIRPSDPTVTELTAPGSEAYTARCMLPNAAAAVRQRRSPSTAPSTSISDGVGDARRPRSGTPASRPTWSRSRRPATQLQQLLMAVQLRGRRALPRRRRTTRARCWCAASARRTPARSPAVYGEAFAG